MYIYLSTRYQPWLEAPPTQQQTLALEEEGWVGVAMWGGMWLRGVGYLYIHVIYIDICIDICVDTVYIYIY
jgi:hypothetical protein